MEISGKTFGKLSESLIPYQYIDITESHCSYKKIKRLSLWFRTRKGEMSKFWYKFKEN